MWHALDQICKYYKPKGSKYQVNSYFVDWKPYIASCQIQKFNEATSLDQLMKAGQIKMNKITQSKLINDIMDQSPVDIGKSKALRDMIDNGYQKY